MLPATLLVIMMVTGLILYALLLHRIPLVSEQCTLRLEDGVLWVNDLSYDLHKLRWMRYDTNSATVADLVIEVSDMPTLHLMVSYFAKDEVMMIQKVAEQIKEYVKEHKIATQNYFDAPLWRVVAWLLLTSIPMAFALVYWYVGEFTIWNIVALFSWTAYAVYSFIFFNHRKRLE